MKVNKTSWSTVLVLGGLVAGCSTAEDRSVQASQGATAPAAADDEDDDTDENEEVVALDQVPEAVKKAALAAVPGLVLTSAEKETEEGSLHYCLEGTAGGEAVEVEVRASDLQVVEIERGEDDED